MTPTQLPLLSRPNITRPEVLLPLALVVLALGMRLAFFILSVRHLPVTSDEASTFLLARDIAAGARPLLFIGQPYQFPAESYLYALVAHLLPNTPLGARLVPFLLCLLALGLSILALSRAYPRARCWPGLLLLLFPSPYLLCLQSAYYIPQYATFLLYVSILMVLLALATRHPQRLSLPMLVGLVSGLAFSGHMLALAPIAGAMLICCAGPGPGAMARRTFAYGLGLVLGLLPFFWAGWFIEGAHQAVTSQKPLAEIANQCFHPVLSSLLPGALGANPPVFPDFEAHLGQQPWLRLLVSGLFLGVLLTATIARGHSLIHQIRERRWPVLGLADAAVVTAWACLLLCVLSSRSSATSHRYALPAVLMVPFLLCAVSTQPGRWMRQAVLVVAIAWTLFNTSVSLALMATWTNEAQLVSAADTPRIKELVAYLDRRKITHVYAPFWLTYRLPYVTDGRIRSAQLYNDRFPFWPVPYKDQVDKENDFAIILPTTSAAARTKKYILVRDLQMGKFKYTQELVGPDQAFLVLRNLRHPPTEHARPLARDGIRCSASDNTATTPHLLDTNPSSVWSSGKRQTQGMWVQCNFPRQRRINRVVLHHRPGPDSAAPILHAQALHQGRWTLAGKTRSGTMHRYRVANRRPVYQGHTQTIYLHDAPAEAIRIEIAQPLPDRDWAMATMEIHHVEDNGG